MIFRFILIQHRLIPIQSVCLLFLETTVVVNLLRWFLWERLKFIKLLFHYFLQEEFHLFLLANILIKFDAFVLQILILD